MSRLKDALMALLGKCTPEGTEPKGNNVDEIIECIAAHFSLSDFVLPNEVSTEEFLQAVEAFENGGASIIWNKKRVSVAYRNGDYVSIRYAEAPCVAYLYNVTGAVVRSNSASKLFYDEMRLSVKVTENNGAYIADKTYAEIKSALQNGKCVECEYGSMRLHLNYFDSYAACFNTVFNVIAGDGSAITKATTYHLQINNENKVVVLSKNFAE